MSDPISSRLNQSEVPEYAAFLTSSLEPQHETLLHTCSFVRSVLTKCVLFRHSPEQAVSLNFLVSARHSPSSERRNTVLEMWETFADSSSRTVHCTLNRPSRNAMPSFHPPVWLTRPCVPNTYEAECISDRGVVASSTIMMTRAWCQSSVYVNGESIWRLTPCSAKIDEYEPACKACEPARGEAVLCNFY